METAALRDLRNSEMKDLERCPIRWHWGWNEQLTPNRTNTKLWMGIGVHEALAQWYQPGLKRGVHPAEFWVDWCNKQMDSDRSIPQPAWEDEGVEYVDAVELGTYMLEQYILKWAMDERYHFIATERTFNMKILTPAEHRRRLRRKYVTRLVGTWDGVYVDLETGEVWLIEHKTSAVGGVPRFIKMLGIDKQTNTYYMAATYLLRQEGLLKPDQNIAGIIFNWLEKYKPSEASEDRTKDPQGVVRNKPQKIDYYEALKDLYEFDDITKLPSIAVMDKMAKDEGITVYGKPSANQPREPGSYFTREAAFRSNGDLRFIYGEIANEGVKRQNLLDGITPITKNPTMDCSWDCNFFRLCELHSAGEDVDDFKSMAYNQKEDRYADHNNRKRA
jgi:hypothetical protein